MGEAAYNGAGYFDQCGRKTIEYFHKKKAWQPTVQEVKKTHPFSLKRICRLLGYSPQAYHKRQQRNLKLQVEEELILQQVDRIRKQQPRCGGRKLFIMLQSFFDQHRIDMGRDRFFDLLRNHRLLIRRRRMRPFTTQSNHRFRRYPNLTRDFKPMKAHELWVTDITYIPLHNRFAYLFLVTDAYSRKIVGFHVSDDMKVSSAIVALKKAFYQKPPEAIVMHHSDRGIQYCSTAYVNLLNQHHSLISMTEKGDPYENAIAERVNGILKTELISKSYSDIDAASSHILRCITIYNHRRRHSSLNWQVPAEVHNQKGPQIKRWKNYWNPEKTKNNLIQDELS